MNNSQTQRHPPPSSRHPKRLPRLSRSLQPLHLLFRYQTNKNYNRFIGLSFPAYVAELDKPTCHHPVTRPITQPRLQVHQRRRHHNFMDSPQGRGPPLLNPISVFQYSADNLFLLCRCKRQVVQRRRAEGCRVGSGAEDG
ncbi:hypothetical protein ACFX14_008476 [Malus domestica]